MKPVISCPRCLRQYRAEQALGGKLGNCSGCGATFIVSIPTLSPGTGEAFVFDKPLEPHYAYFGEACEAMSRHARTLLRLAGEEVTSANLVRFVSTVPCTSEHLARDGWTEWYGSKVLREARIRASGIVEYEAAWRFFGDRIFRMSRDSRNMLIAAFSGILATEDAEPVAPPEDRDFRETAAEARKAAANESRRPWFRRRGR